MTANGRLHWAERARRSARLRALGLMVGRSEMNRHHLPRPVFRRCVLTVWVAYPTRTRADPANAAPTVKPLVDGLTDAGFWTDDDSAHILAVTYARSPRKSPRGRHDITFDIKETKEENDGIDSMA